MLQNPNLGSLDAARWWVVTVAGGPDGEPGFKDGPASEARFNAPVGIAVAEDGDKTFVFVSDVGNKRIRLLTFTGDPWPPHLPTLTATPRLASTRPPATPARVELTPSKDATLFQDDAGAVDNGAGEGLFVGSTNNRSVRRALIAFDLTSIPRGSVVSRVELRLTVTRTQSGPQNVALHRVAADWTQGAATAAGNEGGGAPAATGDATWVHRSFDRTRWARPGGDFAETPSVGVSVAGDGPVTFPSTPQLVTDVQSWVNSPEQNFGWALVGNERDPQTAKRFASREAADARVRPTLIVDLLPPR
jgi:hypothetical protein